MRSAPSDDRLLGCLFLALFCALAFLGGVLAWDALLSSPPGFAP